MLPLNYAGCVNAQKLFPIKINNQISNCCVSTQIILGKGKLVAVSCWSNKLAERTLYLTQYGQLEST